MPNVLLLVMPKTNSNLKTVSLGGQISLGKKFAGQQVIVEQVKDGFWTITAAIVIPKHEEYLWAEPFKSQLDGSLKWAATNPSRATDLDEFEQQLTAHHKTREVVLK